MACPMSTGSAIPIVNSIEPTDYNAEEHASCFRSKFGGADFQAAILSRHGVGKLVGDGFQMPGAFLVKRNQIVKAYRHETSASRPDYL